MYRKFPEESKKLLETIVQFIEPKTGETIVDVGTGAGFLALVLAEKVGKNGKVIGVDTSKQAIQQARRKVLQEISTNYPNSKSEMFTTFPLKMILPMPCVASLYYARLTIDKKRCMKWRVWQSIVEES
jgi:predicted methyltransferase